MKEDKSFEEEFPSLDKEINVEIRSPTWWSQDNIFDSWKKAVQKHCLDKQRVKEAIDKIETYAMTQKSIPTHIKAIYDLKEELGLE